ncbi:hypothetical protein GH5_07526 [Leishmania sp. Ghana 2012 LV757]|uniref:hypothetical protein n=1 Tax=Leishmania sp. Ghana 2012 LV757 TaxID=2803181 RepID=UPI001B4DF6C1|nr:hypothetical protein GH5_07526 [Leishmania sp. Ghana 2012 LV757]
MPPLRRKKCDLDVWAPPPPPLPASSAQASTAAAGAGGPAPAAGLSSAFQQRFANRTEVVGKDGVNAQLGVAAAPANTDATLSAPQPKRGTLAPLPVSGKTTSRESLGAPPLLPALRKHKAPIPVRIRITAPSERTRLSSPPLLKESVPVSSATAAMPRGSGLSLPSTAAARAEEARGAVRRVLAPSAAAVTSAVSRAVPGSGKIMTFGSPLSLLHQDTGLRRRPSTASLSTGTPVASSHAQNSSKAVVTSPGSIPSSTTPSGGDFFSAPRLNRPVKSPRNPKRPVPTTTPTAASVTATSSGLSHRIEQTKAEFPQATRLSQDRCESTPSPSPAAAADQKKRTAYRPYSFSSYKALMAGVATRKSGGLGPSDTDAQRAAREKRERAKAYAKRAMEVARASLAGAGSCADEGEEDPGTITMSHASLSARSSSSGATTTTATTTTTSALTSRSASVIPPEYHKRKQRGARRAAPTPRSTPPQHANRRPSRAATPQPHLSAAAADLSDITPSRSGAESTNAKTPKAAQPASSAPPQRSPAVAAFSVAAAPRLQTIQARRRRERALTYAREVSQKRLQLTPVACEDGGAACAEPQGVASRTRRATKSDGAGNADEDDTWLDDSLVISLGVGQAVDAPDSGRIQRLQRLLELEALHAKKKEAVEVIRRRLRA